MVVKQEKITFNLPSDLKAEVVKLKDELSVSMNSIFSNAIDEYIKQMQRKKLRQEALDAVDEYKKNPERLELYNFEEEIYEY